MRVPLSLSKYYGNVDLFDRPINELVDRIGSQLGAVEEVISLREQYAGVVIARVASCEDHPDADRLHVCKIDDGGKVEGVERDENGYVQVVCGAPNVREGLLVAWLPPGSTVPETFASGDPFVLDARKLRGVLSNGMLASSRELGISDEHDGILEVDEDVAPGTAFSDAYHLNDHVIDIENKMFTHRPDCFGVLGVYREIAGIYHQQFKSPDWYTSDTYSLAPETKELLSLAIHNELPDLTPRFAAIVMQHVVVKPSPVWLQMHLMRAGIRPINNIVDITNYLMALTGQPLHAYDYDKVVALGGEAALTIRHPQEGEKVTLLNGKEIAPKAEAIMIASGQHLLGVGGIMGGSETEVDASTKTIILECATFDMYSVRRTSMAHGLFTDAVTRFNKGQSPLQNIRVLAKAVHEVRTLAQGQVACELIDDNHVPIETQRGSVHEPVSVTTEFVNVRLGLHLTADDMAQLLRNVEFSVEVSGDTVTVSAPYWRTDIEIAEDVVEEVGRLYGYDHLPLDLPKRDITPAQKNPELEAKRNIRSILSRAGANEVLTYTFTHGDLLKKVGQDSELAFRLSNALSPDLQYYRLSLMPSLLERVNANIRAGYEQFALFELGKVHGKSEIDDSGLPREFSRIALVFAAEPKTAARLYAGAPYYQAKQYLSTLLSECNMPETAIRFQPLTENSFGEHKLFMQMTQPFEPKRSAIVFCGERLIGVVGEYKASVSKALKLPAFAAGFEIFGSAFAHAPQPPYAQLSRFPGIEQDMSLKVSADMSYSQLYHFVWDEIGKAQPAQTSPTLRVVDIYQRPDDAAHKQITLRLRIASHDRTMTAEEVNTLLDQVAAKAHQQFGAERV